MLSKQLAIIGGLVNPKGDMHFSSLRCWLRRGAVFLVAFIALSGCVYRPIFDLSADNIRASLSRGSSSEGQESRPMFFLPSGRTKKLPPIVLKITPEVEREVKYFRRGKFVEGALARRNEEFGFLAEILRDEGLPPQLINLALIESGFRKDARSPAGAMGLWQLMKSTARLYGLRVNLFEDQRKDPVLASIAAANLLHDLYYLYDDWYLALAAYNAGTGSINRAMMRTGAADFWTLARTGKLRRETARFVPRFIAACILESEFAAFPPGRASPLT